MAEEAVRLAVSRLVATVSAEGRPDLKRAVLSAASRGYSGQSSPPCCPVTAAAHRSNAVRHIVKSHVFPWRAALS